jgi:hypothetical protein
MIGPDAIKEIIATYEKHGWILRRVLLSAEMKNHIGSELQALFGGAALIDSDISAAWFSRQSRRDSVAWELRRLGPLPFALVEVVDAGIQPEELEEVLTQTEDRLRESGVKPRTGG